MTQSHIPRFGNWEADNIPYSACFDNARKEKTAGFMINPNDPMENPEAFKRVGQKVEAENNEVKASSHTNYSHKTSSSSMEKQSHGVSRNHSRRQLHRRSRGSKGSSFGAEFAVEKSHFDHKRSVSKEASTIGSISSSSHNRHKSASRASHNNDHAKHEATATPEFGNWDVTDPKSGEGYSGIFNKIKEERQIRPSHISRKTTPSLNNSTNTRNLHAEPSSSGLSKYCCCLYTTRN